MTKQKLSQYIALQIEIKDLENRIFQIESTSKSYVQDKVRGSSKSFPYTARSFTIEGYGEDDGVHNEKLKIKDEIDKKKKNALGELQQIEEYISTIDDSLTRTIFRLHFIDGKTQTEVSDIVHLAQSKVSERIREQLKDKTSKSEKVG